MALNLTSMGGMRYFYAFPIDHGQNQRSAAMAKTLPQDTSGTPVSFEDALRELEAIVSSMEKGDLDLDPSLSAYQRGMELLKFCQDRLAAAETKIRVFDQDALRETELPDAD